MIVTVTLNAAIDKRYVVAGAKLGEVNRVLECTYTPGGKGLNVSKPAAIAGAKVVATGLVGGHSGNYIVEGLQPFGIESAFFHLNKESRSCINIWDSIQQMQTEYLEPGFIVEPSEFEAFVEQFETLVEEAEVVAISGSVPQGLDGRAYQRLVRIVKMAGKKVILDTSGELLRMGIEEKPYMVKPNIDEIRMLTGTTCDTREELLQAASNIHEQGVDMVVISLGEEGAVLVCKEGMYRAKVPRIDAVNTVGCGDAMIAGFAIGLEKGLEIEEILRLASAISAATALREETGFFVMEDMERLLCKIEIEKVDVEL